MDLLLHITPRRLIIELKEEFNFAFAYLKIEFYSKDRLARHMISPQLRIGEIQPHLRDGKIEISGKMKVNELEKILKDQFCLAAQVFRKSGNIWLETTMTNNWTLQQQNTHGREISTVKSDDHKTENYDLNGDADH